MEEMIVAVVDDDLDDLVIMTDALSGFDPMVQCRVFHTPEDVIECILEQKEFLPHCIFIDINMPRITGITLLKALRAHSFLAQVKMVMLSSAISEGDRKSLLESGANYTFIKPSEEQGYRDMFSVVLKISEFNTTGNSGQVTQ